MTIQTTRWLTISEACDYLRITRATLYRWARKGMIRLYKVGARSTRVRLEDLQRLATPADEGETAWAALAEDSFARDWDNPLDAAYDNWREIYGVPQG
ncbi:MAG TPA: helix-turn-helix domain-containing protein [Dehalococcoidia bacterium]|jgi:excisionase family DNA binding protein